MCCVLVMNSVNYDDAVVVDVIIVFVWLLGYGFALLG